MGDKIELGTRVGLSGSFKDSLESHGNDGKWHQGAFVYVFLQLSLSTLMQLQRKWRIKFKVGVWLGSHDGGRDLSLTCKEPWSLSMRANEDKRRVSARIDGSQVPVGFSNCLSHGMRVSKLHREEGWYEERIIERMITVMTNSGNVLRTGWLKWSRQHQGGEWSRNVQSRGQSRPVMI